MSLFEDEPSVEEAAGPAKRIKQLEDLILHHRELYYGSGETEIGDNEYDAIEEELRQLDPKNKVLNKIGSTKFSMDEVPLPVPCPSFDKVRPDTGADKWLAKNPGPYCLSDKLDGISIELDYVPKELVKAYTRGEDGLTGVDISHLCPHMDIPQRLNKRLTVRGELIMSKANFNKWSVKYKNARNLATGVKNKTTQIHEAAKDMHVVVYAQLAPRGKPSAVLKELKAMGFTMVAFKVVDKVSVAELQTMFAKRKQASPYEVDGIVIETDVKTPAPKTNPKNACAFKDVLAIDSAEVVVTKVTWEESRYHKLTPRVWFEPVRLSGVDVQKATCHNARALATQKIGPGAIIKVVRSGDVIPFIVSVIKPAKKWAAPEGVEGTDWSWVDNGKGEFVDIFVNQEAGASDRAQVRQISHFFSGMDVDGLREGTAQKLFSAGFTTINQIMRAKPAEYAAALGPNNAQKLGAEIRAKLKVAYPATLAYAWAGFGRGCGSTRLWACWEGLGNATMALMAKWPASKIEPEVAQFTGPAAAKMIAANLPAFYEFVKEIPTKLIEYEPEEVTLDSEKLKGQAVGFTGFRDAALTDLIVKNGGTVTDGVKKETTILLLKDVNSSSSKAAEARKRGLPLMTPQDFIKKWKL